MTPSNRLAILLAILVVASAARIPFVGPSFFAENPDAVLQVLFLGDGLEPGSPAAEVREAYWPYWASSYPPLFPYCIRGARRVVSDPLLAGRLVALLSGILLAAAAYLLAREVCDDRSSLLAALLTAFSPLLFYYSVKVRPEMLFTLFVTLSLWAILRLYRRQNSVYLFGALASGGLALFTKLDGLLLLPLLALVSLGSLFRRDLGGRRFVHVATGLLFFLPTLWWLWAHGVSGKVDDFGFQQLLDPRRLAQVVLWSEASVFATVYLATFPVAALFLIGLFGPARRSGPEKGFLALALYILGANLAVHAVYTNWQTRYFTLPMPVLCVGAAWAVGKLRSERSPLRRGLGSVLAVSAVLFSLVYSVAMLRGEKDLFLDVKAVALHARETLPDEAVLTDERVLTAYFSDKYARPYAREAVAPGRLIALHDLFCVVSLGRTVEEELRWLEANWKIRVVHETTVRFTPISGNALNGEVLDRIEGNYPMFLDYRYTPLESRSLLVRVLERRDGEEETGEAAGAP